MTKSSEKARQFLSLGALVALVILPQECEGLAGEDPEVEIHREALTVTSATFGAWVDYQDVYGPEEFHGDTFQTAWSDDGNLYMAADDSWIPTWNYNYGKGANVRLVGIGNHSVTSWTTPPTMTFTDVNTTLKNYGRAGQVPPNYITTNPGFEAGTLNHWTANGGAVVSTTSKHTGTYSAKVTTTSDGVSRAFTNLTPGTIYEISAWMRTGNSSDTIAIGAENYAGVNSKIWTTTNSTTFTHVVTRFKTTGTTATIWCWKWSGSSASYCDDVLLEERRAWKTGGVTSVGGNLYLTLGRHDQQMMLSHVPPYQQDSRDGHIIMSTDKGVSWRPAPPQPGTKPYPVPMFPGPRFGYANFVQYGQNAAAPDGYVYAVSPTAWDNGNGLFIGRVMTANLPNLNGSQWEFWQGGSTWTAGAGGLNSAASILTVAGKLGGVSVQYVSQISKYLLLAWSYPNLNRATCQNGDPNVPDITENCIKTTRWHFYQSSTLTGTWSKIDIGNDGPDAKEKQWDPEGFYQPAIVNKYIESSVQNNQLRMWLFTAGNFTRAEYYKLIAIPMTLNVQ